MTAAAPAAKKASEPSRRRRSTAAGALSRRRLLRGAACLAPLVVPSSVLGLDGHVAPSERINLGLIGTGTRGMQLLDAMQPLADAQVVAVCDCRRDRLEHAGRFVGRGRPGGPPGLHGDFHDLLDRPDVDAVVVAVPDHWHGVLFARVLEAGKDLYGEKPVTRGIAEGAEICRLVRRHARIFQTGTQQRSWPQFRQACALARNGHLGTVRRIEVGVPGGRAYPTVAPCLPPPGFDYEMWTGPAAFVPFDPQRCEWLAMYMISHYSAGFITNWGVHHLDIAGWGCPEVLASPFEVEGSGVMPTEGMTDTWISWQARLVYASGLEVSFSSQGQPHPLGCRFVGDAGWVHVDRAGIWAGPSSLLRAPLRPGDDPLYAPPAHADPVTAHVADFLRSVRTRQDPGVPVEVGHASSTLGNVCDIALRLGRPLRWDPGGGVFVGDDEANALRHRPLRGPWAI